MYIYIVCPYISIQIGTLFYDKQHGIAIINENKQTLRYICNNIFYHILPLPQFHSLLIVILCLCTYICTCRGQGQFLQVGSLPTLLRQGLSCWFCHSVCSPCQLAHKFSAGFPVSSLHLAIGVLSPQRCIVASDSVLFCFS